jgi:hypothetical protein
MFSQSLVNLNPGLRSEKYAITRAYDHLITNNEAPDMFIQRLYNVVVSLKIFIGNRQSLYKSLSHAGGKQLSNSIRIIHNNSVQQIV